MLLPAVTEGHYFVLSSVDTMKLPRAKKKIMIITHFRKEAKLSSCRQHAGHVVVEQFNQLAVITPHQLLHRLCQEGFLLQGTEPNADEQPQVNRQFFQHDGCTLKTQMAFSNEGWRLCKDGHGKKEGGSPEPACLGW